MSSFYVKLLANKQTYAWQKTASLAEVRHWRV